MTRDANRLTMFTDHFTEADGKRINDISNYMVKIKDFNEQLEYVAKNSKTKEEAVFLGHMLGAHNNNIVIISHFKEFFDELLTGAMIQLPDGTIFGKKKKN